MICRRYTKFYGTDVDAAVRVCCLLHQRYAEFIPDFIPAIVKQIAGTVKPAQESEQVYLHYLFTAYAVLLDVISDPI